MFTYKKKLIKVFKKLSLKNVGIEKLFNFDLQKSINRDKNVI